MNFNVLEVDFVCQVASNILVFFHLIFLKLSFLNAAISGHLINSGTYFNLSVDTGAHMIPVGMKK